MITPFPYERKRIFRQLLIFCCPLVFAVTLFAQAVFATTYVITDGPRVYTYTAFTADPAAILDGAGLELDERDSYTTETLSGTSSITIRRALSVTLLYHGASRSVPSSGETVGQLLSRLELPITQQDRLSHSPEDPVFDGMVLRIDRILRMQQQSTRVLPRSVITCASDQLPAGTRETLVPGRDGELLCTEEVTFINGQESRREVLREDVVTAPISAVVAVGTGPAPANRSAPVIGDGIIRLPSGQVLTYTHTGTVRATAYTHTDAGCNMTTATGSTVHVGTVAVDPRYIPYGTRMFIVAQDGSYIYGLSEAEDCGGDIIGDRVDLYLPTFEDCMAFGRKDCTVYYLG